MYIWRYNKITTYRLHSVQEIIFLNKTEENIMRRQAFASKRKLFFISLVILGSIFVSSIVYGAQKNFEMGTYLRVRHEFWKNIFDFENSTKDNRNYFRIKSSLWSKLEINDTISLFAKFTDEFKAYTYLYKSASGKKGERFDINEIVFDNLYLDIKKVFGSPVDLRLGRQDFLVTYGEGFLIMDGTPFDGSRTFYFNAAKASLEVNEKNTVDAIYINNHREDDIFPIMNELSPHQQLNASDEQGALLYWKGKPVENLSWDKYYFFKRESGGGPRLQSQTSNLHTIGSFAKYNFSPWSIKGQIAYQFGDYGEFRRSGLGGYAYLERAFKDVKWSPTVRTGFIFLSGDDPSTDSIEGWNPLFSRWPWMSELYSLSFNGESGLDYWTNLQMWRAELLVLPTAKTKIRLWYNFLRANEIPRSTSFALGGGKNRGHLPQARIDYKISDNINAYILVEYFIPGNFHADTADSALFLRSEITFKF